MRRSLVILLLALAPLVTSAEPVTGIEGDPQSRAAEAILLGVERQAQRTGVTIWQSGRGNEAAVSQSGSGNKGIVVQRGRGHDALLVQSGTGNTATIVQLGRGASSVVVQMGGEVGASVQIGQSGH